MTLKLAFTPAQHRSGRGMLDHMTTLWGSWCVGVVEPEDSSRARDLGMNDWKGFKAFFGGSANRYLFRLRADTKQGYGVSVCYGCGR